MSQRVSSYKCPNCNGPLSFDPKIQKLKCSYCDSEFSEQEVIDFYDSKKEDAIKAEDLFQAQAKNWSAEEKEAFSSYTCSSCGAVLLTDQNTAVTSCPYCGNNAILEGRFQNEHKPNYVIPFSLTKEDAQDALLKFYEGKPLLPKLFKDENHLKKIQGVYVPFFLYDGNVQCSMRFDCSRSETHREGDYLVTNTHHFLVTREGTMDFTKIPCDASSTMPDAHMDGIEPFPYDKLVDFKTLYMAGYLADLDDVPQEETYLRAKQRMYHSTNEEVFKTLFGYTSILPLSRRVDIQPTTIQLAYLPVYLLTTTYRNQTYLYAVNGTNGKVAGKLPASNGKALAMFVGITILIFLFLLFVTGLGGTLL